MIAQKINFVIDKLPAAEPSLLVGHVFAGPADFDFIQLAECVECSG